MIDKEKIPESTYKELIELFGIEDAERIIIKKRYNFLALSHIIFGERLIRHFRLENFRIWLKKFTGLSMKSRLVILVIIGFIVFFFLPF